MKFFAPYGKSRRCVIHSCTAVLFLLIPINIQAGEINIDASASVTESYSDNILLGVEGEEESELITQFQPAVSISAIGARVKANLKYSLQKQTFLSNDREPSTYHQLNFKTRTELARNKFFVDTLVARSQYNINNDKGVALDNLTANDRQNVTNYFISPSFISDYNDVAEVRVLYSVGRVTYGEGLADSGIETLFASLSSGRNSKIIKWEISGKYQFIDRDEVNDIKQQSVKGEADYLLKRQFKLKVIVGSENNDILDDDTATENNGAYSAFGLGWEPSDKFELTVFDGVNYKSQSIMVKPTYSTEFKLTRFDRNFGVSIGESWDGYFKLKSNHTNLSAAYTETKTSFQQIQPQEDVGNTPVLIPPTDSVFLQKQGKLTFEKKSAKTTFTLSYFDERREFTEDVGVTDIDSKVLGGTAKVNWKATGHSSLSLMVRDEAIKFVDGSFDSRLKVYEIGLKRESKRKASISFLLRKVIRESEADLVTDYEENRIDLKLQLPII